MASTSSSSSIDAIENESNTSDVVADNDSSDASDDSCSNSTRYKFSKQQWIVLAVRTFSFDTEMRPGLGMSLAALTPLAI